MNKTTTMSNPKSIAAIKAGARDKLLGNYKPSAGASFLYLLLSFLIIECFTVAPTGTGLAAIIINLLLGILSYTLTEILRFGICHIFLKLNSHQPVRTSDIFFGIRERSGRVFPVALLFSSISMLATLPYSLYMQFVPSGQLSKEVHLILQAVFIVAGIMLYYVFYLRLSMTYYILLDFPKMPALRALKMSVWLTKGHRMRFLGLQFSFLPLQLLGILSCGIGSLFICPYQYASEANFYLSLTALKAAK